MLNLLALAVSAAVSFGLPAAPAAQDTAACSNLPHTREIFTVLDFGNDVFEEENWVVSAQEEADRTQATWYGDAFGAVAFLDYLHFDCGIRDDDVEPFFNDEWFAATFSNREDYKLRNQCEEDGVLLWEFDIVTTYNDGDILRYWVSRDSDERISAFYMEFPLDQEDLMNEYAEQLYPGFVSCDE